MDETRPPPCSPEPIPHSARPIPQSNRRLVLRRVADHVRDAGEVVAEPVRQPGPGEVVVRHRWAGVNPLFDREVCRDRVPYRRVEPGQGLGVEAVGVIAAVGEGATLAVGAPVATTGFGTGYQLWQTLPEADVVAVPAATPEVLALVLSGASALVALEAVARVRPGETLAVSAAAGGLGHLVVQLAKRKGARVVGVCGGAEKGALVRSLGADVSIDYRAEDLADALRREAPGGLDVALDSVGREVYDAFLGALAPGGRLVVIGRAAEFEASEPEVVTRPRLPEALYWRGASVHAFMNARWPDRQADARARLFRWHADGDLRVRVDRQPFEGLEAIADAADWVFARRNQGKVVVRLG